MARIRTFLALAWHAKRLRRVRALTREPTAPFPQHHHHHHQQRKLSGRTRAVDNIWVIVWPAAGLYGRARWRALGPALAAANPIACREIISVASATPTFWPQVVAIRASRLPSAIILWRRQTMARAFAMPSAIE